MHIGSLIDKKAYNYEWAADGKPFPIARFRNLSPIGPAGAMYSTIGDMDKWARAIFYPNKTLAQKNREHFYPNNQGYSYGIMHSKLSIQKGQKINFAFVNNPSQADENLKDFIWHNGQIAGTFALIGFLPARKIHLIVLSNIGFTFPQQDFMTSVLMSVEGGESPPSD